VVLSVFLVRALVLRVVLQVMMRVLLARLLWFAVACATLVGIGGARGRRGAVVGLDRRIGN
jgi:hypothetical protein